MRDIGRLEHRLENIEYYTQLSLLESEATNMQIQDADGFDRFKNGIIVDNFTGHGIADVSDADYRVSMDMANGELRPAFSQDNASLKEIQSDLSTAITDTARAAKGYQKTGDLITLPYTTYTHIDQPYASTTVNLNPYDTIPFIGNVSLSPDMDEWMDTQRQPEMVVDIPGSFDTLTTLASEKVLELNLGTVWNNWNDSWVGVPHEINKQTSLSVQDNRRTTTTTITTEQRVQQNRSGVRTALVPNTVKSSLGDRVTSVAFVSFIRSKDITFTGSGLRPNTRVYPFFDEVDVSDYVTPTGSTAGAALTTDANGNCLGVFSIPNPARDENPRWRTGRKTFRLTSNSKNFFTGDVFTSAESDYIAKGMMNTVQGTVVSTREPQVARTSLSESTIIKRKGVTTDTQIEILERRAYNQPSNNNNDTTPGITPSKIDTTFAGVYLAAGLTSGGGASDRSRSADSLTTSNAKNYGLARATNAANVGLARATNAPNFGIQREVNNGPPGRNYGSVNQCKGFRGDPLSQSFAFDTIGGIFVSSVDLYFSSKSSTLPVTMELRTMFNGYPTEEIIPFGKVDVAATDITTSADASEATKFTFPSPVYLQSGQQYCFVALCSTDEYTIYSA